MAPEDDRCTTAGLGAGVDGVCAPPLGIRGVIGALGFSLCGAGALSCIFGVGTGGTGDGAAIGVGSLLGKTGAGLGSADLTTLNLSLGPDGS